MTVYYYKAFNLNTLNLKAKPKKAAPKRKGPAAKEASARSQESSRSRRKAANVSYKEVSEDED